MRRRSPSSRAFGASFLSRADGNKIYTCEESDGLLQALSFGRFVTICPGVAVLSVRSVTNSQPSSPSLFSRVNSSLELWNCWTRYSHFCMNYSGLGFFFPHRASAAFISTRLILSTSVGHIFCVKCLFRHFSQKSTAVNDLSAVPCSPKQNDNPRRAPSIARTCSPPHFHRTLSR